MYRHIVNRIIATTLLLLLFSNPLGYGLTSTRALAGNEAIPTARQASESLALEGEQAIDYLKQQGAYDRVRQQVRAASHTATPSPMTGAMQMQPASCLNWVEEVQVAGSDADASDQFGFSVALSGDTIVVGAAGDDVGSNNFQGSAYIFERDLGGSNNWGEVIQLIASDGAAFDRFGTSVAISNNAIVVGAPQDDFAGISNSGSAYLFVTDCEPTILPATLNRQRNSSQNEFITAVNDDRTPAGNLSVTALGTPSGITITDIVNSAGTVTATVTVDCTASR